MLFAWCRSTEASTPLWATNETIRPEIPGQFRLRHHQPSGFEMVSGDIDSRTYQEMMLKISSPTKNSAAVGIVIPVQTCM